jgi:hypothetical protein
MLMSLMNSRMSNPSSDTQLIADILDEYRDDLTKEACDNCEQCGQVVMCSFHSVLSALSRRTWTEGAIKRATLSRRQKS